MFARRLIPVMPLLFLALENEWDHRCLPHHRWVVGVILLVMAAAPIPIYNDVRIRIKGVADEPRFYPTEVIEMRKRQAESVGKALAGLDVKVGFEGGMCGFGYYSRLPYLAEMSGLTQYSLAELPLSARGHIGHEKSPTREWFLDNNIHFVVRQSVPSRPAENRIPRAFNEIHFGEVAKALIVLYSDDIMDPLRRDPNVSFTPIEEVLEDVRGVIETTSLANAEAIFMNMDDYYFRGAGDRGKEEFQRMRELVEQKRITR